MYISRHGTAGVTIDHDRQPKRTSVGCEPKRRRRVGPSVREVSIVPLAGAHTPAESSPEFVASVKVFLTRNEMAASSVNPSGFREIVGTDNTDAIATALTEIKRRANVVGLQRVAPIELFPMDAYDRLQAVMLRAPTLLAKLCVPRFREYDHSCDVGNMASVHGHYVTADKVAHSVAKFGVRRLTNSAAAEGDGGFRALSVSTGYVKTPLVTEQIPDTAKQCGLSVDEVIEDVMLGQARTTEMMELLGVANQFVYGFSAYAAHLNGADLLHDDGVVNTHE